MKVDKKTLIEISKKFKLVIKHFKLDIVEKPTDTDLWRMWHWIHEEIAYDNSHPRFDDHKRIFEYDPNHSLYPCDTNDKTMTTALRKAYKLL